MRNPRAHAEFAANRWPTKKTNPRPFTDGQSKRVRGGVVGPEGFWCSEGLWCSEGYAERVRGGVLVLGGVVGPLKKPVPRAPHE